LARIAGVNLPNQKRLEIGLTYIYGIGQSTAQKVCKELGLDPDEKVKDLTDDEVTKLRTYIDGNLEVEGDLRRESTQAIKRLSEIGAYRGVRHRRNLPVHGQRTKTNARTRKGPKKGAIAKKKTGQLRICTIAKSAAAAPEGPTPEKKKCPPKRKTPFKKRGEKRIVHHG